MVHRVLQSWPDFIESGYPKASTVPERPLMFGWLIYRGAMAGAIGISALIAATVLSRSSRVNGDP